MRAGARGERDRVVDLVERRGRDALQQADPRRSDCSKSSSPRMAASVTRATSSSQPACAASISITSPWISVESTSITISRIAAAERFAGCTARSMPWHGRLGRQQRRSTSGSAPET